MWNTLLSTPTRKLFRKWSDLLRPTNLCYVTRAGPSVKMITSKYPKMVAVGVASFTIYDCGISYALHKDLPIHGVPPASFPIGRSFWGDWGALLDIGIELYGNICKWTPQANQKWSGKQIPYLLLILYKHYAYLSIMINHYWRLWRVMTKLITAVMFDSYFHV